MLVSIHSRRLRPSFLSASRTFSAQIAQKLLDIVESALVKCDVPQKPTTLLVCVSGGCDSVALLELIVRTRERFNQSIQQLTHPHHQIDHFTKDPLSTSAGKSNNDVLPPTSATIAEPPLLALEVVHFDHCLRAESSDDAKFVQDLATKYNLPFYLREAHDLLKANSHGIQVSQFFILLCSSKV
jgi:tRNA(Ile)-lysidine synthase TilS/MesJ